MNKPNYKSFSELYPMPMTSIEKFHWFDDHPDYPNLVFCRIRIADKLDQQLARDAWQYTIQRQPCGDLEPKLVDGKWTWVQGPRAEGNENIESWNGTRFEWMEHETEPEAWSLKDHTVGSSTGSYLGVSSWPAKESDPLGGKFVSEIHFYVHHALGDGAGSIMCINDWMQVYSNLLGGLPAEQGLHKLDSSLMKRRNHLGLTRWRYLKHLWKQPIALFGATKFVFRKTKELLPTLTKKSNSETSAVFPAIIGKWLSQDQVEAIENQAKNLGVMTNTLLLGQLYLALADWRTEHAGHKNSDWIRIILPISIRNVSDRHLPTANRATIVQIDRRSSDASDLKSFYQGIDYEISVIRGWQLDKMFLIVIRFLSTFDSLLKRSARTEKSRGMALFTNLGSPLRRTERTIKKQSDSAAVIRPKEFDFVGPIRKGTPANFSVSKYQKRMRISLQYDNRTLDETQANELLGAYANRLIRLEG